MYSSLWSGEYQSHWLVRLGHWGAAPHAGVSSTLGPTQAALLGEASGGEPSRVHCSALSPGHTAHSPDIARPHCLMLGRGQPHFQQENFQDLAYREHRQERQHTLGNWSHCNPSICLCCWKWTWLGPRPAPAPLLSRQEPTLHPWVQTAGSRACTSSTAWHLPRHRLLMLMVRAPARASRDAGSEPKGDTFGELLASLRELEKKKIAPGFICPTTTANVQRWNYEWG